MHACMHVCMYAVCVGVGVGVCEWVDCGCAFAACHGPFPFLFPQSHLAVSIFDRITTRPSVAGHQGPPPFDADAKKVVLYEEFSSPFIIFFIPHLSSSIIG